MKPFYRVAIGFLVADYVAGVVAWGVARSLVSSDACNADLGCIIAGPFNLFLALAAFVMVALGLAAMLSVAASQLAPPGRRVLAGAIHLPLLAGTLLLTAYLAKDPVTVVLVVPVFAAAATAAIATATTPMLHKPVSARFTGDQPGGRSQPLPPVLDELSRLFDGNTELL